MSVIFSLPMRYPGDLLKALLDAGCAEFIGAAGRSALSVIESTKPELSSLLSAETRASLLEDFRQRMLLIYIQVLLTELNEKIRRYDPAGFLTGNYDPDAVRAAAADMAAVNGGDLQTFLHGKYPLLEEYRACTEKNFLDSFSAFFDAFFSQKTAIEERFLAGQTIRELSGLSAAGADIHRHGRCVIGVKTNAGSFYYKPHDCGLDGLYHEIVSRWFSDCTAAPDVIAGSGYAFVSCLQHEPVRTKEEIADYFYRFGILSALFHGLGSTDMHHENMMAVGGKPSAVDIETILAMPEVDNGDIPSQVRFTQKDHIRSLARTCILPERMYKGPLISPLYSASGSAVSLPEFEGKRFTVEGYEEDFIRGFREGYSRMLSHREELIGMLKQRKGIPVRCLLRGTQFYAVLRQRLFLPENLLDESTRQKVYDLLRSQYKGASSGMDLGISEYEWKCILGCDIPYFCAALDGKDLCGEDPSQPVWKGFYVESPCDAAVRFLERLSEDEERFETELIRNYLEHAPTDVSKIPEKEPVTADAPDPERIKEEIFGILAELKKGTVYSTDNTPLWISAAMNVKKLMGCGNLTLYAGIGAFCTAVRECRALLRLKSEAGQLAEEMCSLIRKEMDRGKSEWPDSIGEALPAGIYAGFGGILEACALMERSRVKGSEGLMDAAAELISAKKPDACRNLSFAEGTAGLTAALTDAAPCNEDGRACLRLCADRLLEEALPTRADSAYGCAGTGAALIAAYGILQDRRCYRKALQAFQKVDAAFDPKLDGWPDGNAKVRVLAGKGPHAAGIFIAAEHAKTLLSGSGLEDTEELSSLLDRISMTALRSLLGEKQLTHNDTLDQGNALGALALLKAGETDAAGSILAAMLRRKERNGSFMIMEPGIRSTFDPSFFIGTLGIGYAMTAYLDSL